MHAHLDHDNCMEVTILRGKAAKVQHFGEHVIAERGVRHGRIVLMPTETVPPRGGGARRRHHHADGARQ
jgi:CopG family nickel-responsive transcriptional regulator